MDYKQIELLVDKVHECVVKTVNQPNSSNISYTLAANGKVKTVEYKNVRATVILNLIYKNELEVTFKVNMDSSYGTYIFPWSYFKWLSKIWRKWYHITSIIEDVEKVKREHAAAVRAEKEVKIFNESFHTAFPDEINEILLDAKGDDDHNSKDS